MLPAKRYLISKQLSQEQKISIISSSYKEKMTIMLKINFFSVNFIKKNKIKQHQKVFHP